MQRPGRRTDPASSLRAVAQDADRSARELHSRLEEIGISASSAGRLIEHQHPDDREHREQHRVAVIAARSAQANALQLLGTQRSDWVEAAADLRSKETLEGPRQQLTIQVTQAADLVTDEVSAVCERPDLG